MNQQKDTSEASTKTMTEPTQQLKEKQTLSVKEQMDLLQQIKNLLDAGVLTQEEFEKKKQEVLNS